MTKLLIIGLITGEGGIQTHLNCLAKILEEEEINTLFLAKKVVEEQCNPYSSVKFVSFEPNKDQPTNSFISALQNIYTIKTIIEKFAPDVYLAVGTGFYSVLPVYLARHKPRKVFHEVMSGLKSGWTDSRWMVRWNFDEVIAHTPTVAANFAKSFGWTKEIPVLSAIPSPLELTTSLPKPTYKSVPLGQAKAALFSRLVPHKRAFWLVQQWEYLKDILSELHIHGGGPEESLIRDYIETNGIGDRVKCFGRYPEGQAYVDLMSSYDLTLLPTLGDEGAPLVLLESMACGVPFVTYGVGGISDYGVENPNVIIVPLEPCYTDQTGDYFNAESSTDNLFINAVRKMLFDLAQGEINKVELQKLYLEKYSYSVLKNAWISYLCN